jgi:hypothetical protein
MMLPAKWTFSSFPFRVPTESVIHRVFYDDLPYAEAEENLALWRSSDGKRLADRQVRVKAKRLSGSIHALILPLERAWPNPRLPFSFSSALFGNDLAELFEQLQGAYLQRSREGCDNEQRRIRPSSFEKTRVVPVQVGEFSQLLLWQSVLFAELTQAHSEGF